MKNPNNHHSIGAANRFSKYLKKAVRNYVKKKYTPQGRRVYVTEKRKREVFQDKAFQRNIRQTFRRYYQTDKYLDLPKLDTQQRRLLGYNTAYEQENGWDGVRLVEGLLEEMSDSGVQLSNITLYSYQGTILYDGGSMRQFNDALRSVYNDRGKGYPILSTYNDPQTGQVLVFIVGYYYN